MVDGAICTDDYENADSEDWIYLDFNYDGSGTIYVYSDAYTDETVTYDDDGNVISAWEGSSLIETNIEFLTMEDGSKVFVDTSTMEKIYVIIYVIKTLIWNPLWNKNEPHIIFGEYEGGHERHFCIGGHDASQYYYLVK